MHILMDSLRKGTGSTRSRSLIERLAITKDVSLKTYIFSCSGEIELKQTTITAVVVIVVVVILPVYLMSFSVSVVLSSF